MRSCAVFPIFNSANTYAKTPPLASFHADYNANRSVESPCVPVVFFHKK